MSTESMPANAESNVSLILPGVDAKEAIKIERYPSDDYHAHTDSLGYRLSELVFGSLLVAYVTGFLWVAFSNPCINPNGEWDLSAFYTLLCAICLSVAFGMITAALYVSYHFGALTMPVPASGKLGRDFLLAISQVGFYGLALIWPNLMLFWLALSILPVLARQRTFSIQLAQAAITVASIKRLVGTEHQRGADPHAQKSINDGFLIDRLKKGMDRIRDESTGSTYASAWSSWYPASIGDLCVVLTLALSALALIVVTWSIETNHVKSALPKYLFQSKIHADHHWITAFNAGVSLLIARRCRAIIDVRTILSSPQRTPTPSFDPHFAFDHLWKNLVATFANSKSDEIQKS